MKKLLACLLVALMLVPMMAMGASAEEVTLVMGSWRNTDAPMVEALLAKYKEISGVNIVFEPTVSAQYNSVLRLQLDSGTGPDLYYSRSYSAGEELYTAGFSMDCTDVPGVKENFTDASREPWTAADGKVYAVPFAAVSQVIYYNKNLGKPHHQAAQLFQPAAVPFYRREQLQPGHQTVTGRAMFAKNDMPRLLAT